MSALTLVPKTAATSAEACPVVAGDLVFVPHPVDLPSGRRIRSKNYTVLQAEWCETRRAWRLVIEAELDCSQLKGRAFRPPTDQQKQHARSQGLPPPREPLCALPTRVYLDAGDYTAYDTDITDGRHAATIEDRP